MKVQPLTTSVRPGYSIRFHPRAFNKPLYCQSGRHSRLRTVVDANGMPVLVCANCGSQIFKGVYEKTLTKEELKDPVQERKPRTKEQIIKDSWARLEEYRRKMSDEAIRKYVRQRLASDRL